MCKSQAKSFFSKPHLPTSSWAQALAFQLPPGVSWEFNSSLLSSFSGHKRTLCPVPPQMTPLSVPLPFTTKLMTEDAHSDIYHFTLHGCQALFNLLYESCTKKKMLNDKPYTQNVDEFPPKLPCTRRTIPCKWEKWSCGMFVWSQDEKSSHNQQQTPSVSLQKL